jgi:hypothetical protein
MLSRLSAPRWSGSVASWCAGNVRFQEPKLSGPFNFSGREYLREILDAWGDDTVKDMVGVMGTRTGKTRAVFGGLAWRIKHNPTRCLWVMPNSHGTGGAQNVSRTRFQPMIRSSPALASMIPRGAQRHEFKTLQMIINGSIIDLAGSNSPANLAGNPCDCVVQDETDKYQARGDREAHPSRLADERAKEFANPKRIKFSTPTLFSGLIWQEFLKTDMRRRHVPCPHCGKFVVFAWSERFSVLPKLGCEAYVRWDQDARTADGWDEDKVHSSAYAECPFCKGKIRDEHKVEMDRQGVWKPTRIGSPYFRGWHLPSMYSVSAETSFGRMAVRFLQAKRSLEGLHNFVNSDLAEPYIGQENQSKRVELITSKLEVTAEWVKLLEVDCQAKGPEYFWLVVRAWNGGNSEGIEAVGVGTFEDVRDIQKKHGIQDAAVMIDSGFGARDDAEVYRTCARFCEIIPSGQGGRPMAVGWMPAKGMPTRRRWKDENGLLVPYYLRSIDPFMGTADAGKVSMTLFEFAGSAFKDILDSLRKGKGGYTWKVSESMSTETYWRHMDAEIKSERFNQSTGVSTYDWKPRSRHWPNHLFDCEVMQVAHAAFLGLFEIPETKE